MDWNAVIERNREALKRVLAALVAMAGLGPTSSSPLVGEDGPARRGKAEALAGPGEGYFSNRATLPRHLHRAVLRLLRPAEAAVRRLVIVAARDIVLPPLAPSRPRKPKPTSAAPVLRSLGIAIVVPHNLPHPQVRSGAKPRRAEVRALSLPKGELPRTPARKIALPLFDAIRTPKPGRPRYVPAHAAPRILSFDGPRPHRLPPPPAPGDPIDATRLALRLEALASALDDLPKHARRFARWRMRRARPAATLGPPLRSGGSEGRARPVARPGKGPPKAVEGARNRFVRHSPLRPGRPPGLSAANRRRPAHEIHEVLGDLQHFAVKALEQPDTS